LKKNDLVFRIQVKAGVNDFGHFKAHTANRPEVYVHGMFLSRFGVCRRLERRWQTPSLLLLLLLLYRRIQKRVGPPDTRSASGLPRA
jgi:hypothetical protein